MDLNELADELLAGKNTAEDEVQNMIHKDILIRYNSVTLLVGSRGSGKTYWLCRELAKIAYCPGNRYSQVYYITDKQHDDTFEYIQKCIKNLEIVWVSTKDALKVINALSYAKAHMNEDEMYRKALNAEDFDCVPHTLIIFDDCIGLFTKQTALAKRLYENRQSRITYILALQDVQGISPSMKANIDGIAIWGGFPKHKWNILTYQLPSVDGLDWETYSQLQKHDYMLVDFINSTVRVQYRE